MERFAYDSNRPCFISNPEETIKAGYSKRSDLFTYMSGYGVTSIKLIMSF